MLKAILLCNPVAGRVPLTEPRLIKLLESLYRYGIECEPVITQASGIPLNSLDVENREMLIVFGGDGTFHQALTLAVRWKVPMALLPSGTANVLARELGIPLDWERALGIVCRGKLRRMNLGWTNGRYFHLMAGVGFDGFVVAEVNERIKRALGVAAYWWTAFTCLSRYPMKPFLVKLDGETFQATSAVIGNSRNYGDRLLVTPRASVFERCLDVCVFTSQKRSRYLTYFLGALTGKHVDFSDVIYRKVSRAEVVTDDPIPIQMDGESAGHGVIEASCFSEGIDMVVP